ncbi:MAG: type II secretion system F family protein [Phycisphaerae bacterium]|nr:type II secretion system F family protein [Phycisphaerae bacterium]
MPRFNYLARDTSGGSLKGEIVAKTPAEAARMLRAEGKYVVKLRELAEQVDRQGAQVITLGQGRVRQEDIIFFFNQLSIMVETGVSLTDAIHGILAQTSGGRFRAILERVLHDVESGEAFSTALSNHPKIFDTFFVNLVRAAEASGTLGPMLTRCAEYLAHRREIRKKVKSALTYPLALLMVAVGVTVFLMTYVLPKFLSIYAGKEATLPMPTLVLMTVTNGMVDYWMWLLAATLVGVVVLIWFFRARSMRPYAHWMHLHTPLIGKMLLKSNITMSLRTLGILVDSGVSMLDAISITRAVSKNYYFDRMWSEVDKHLHRGEQLSTPLYNDPLIPRPLVQMIEAGERSGRLGTVLVRLCDFLDDELRITIKTVTQMIEPAMIAIMGVIVGGIAIALLLPIMSISKVVAQ